MIGVNKGPCYRGRDSGDMVKKEEAEELARRLNVDLFVEIATADKDQVEQFLSHLICFQKREEQMYWSVAREEVLSRYQSKGKKLVEKNGLD
jgi:hypothetical protein